MLYPLLRTLPPRTLEVYLVGGDPKIRQRFAVLFTEAENHELREQRPDLALPAYRQSYEVRISDSLKALALARMARCLRKVDQAKEAEQAYRTLWERYGDSYDTFHRPYALTAALDLDDLARTQGQPSPGPLVNLYHDLVRGRWELSAEQVDYFRAKLEERLGGPSAGLNQTEYLSHLELARALEEGFRHAGPLRSGEVYAQALARAGSDYQTYYTLLPSAGGRETLVGFAVNLGWVKDELLPRCLSDLGMEEKAGVISRAENPGARDVPVRVGFPTVLPFWELSLAPAPGRIGQAGGRRDLLIFTSSTLLILSVLILGVILLMRDVSRQIRLNQLRADFISGVSHELRTPLTLIRLYAEMLSHGGSFPEEERRTFYQIITGESERLTHLIENVLDFSRLERGQREYDLRAGDLAPVVARTVEVYRQYLERRGFSMQTDLAPHLPPVHFDAEAISQAVLNLLDNAVKYSGESRFVGVRLRSEDNKVIFEVEDHGIGIPAGEREKIFQQFYRGRGGTEKGGYGLGLFLVKHIMNAHGGMIELESEEGRGSKFRLIFPVRASGAET
jgi:signal transduction histidine kinase